jgi:hypothetical protein
VLRLKLGLGNIFQMIQVKKLQSSQLLPARSEEITVLPTPQKLGVGK